METVDKLDLLNEMALNAHRLMSRWQDPAEIMRLANEILIQVSVLEKLLEKEPLPKL